MSDRVQTIRKVLQQHGKLASDAAAVDEGASLYAAGLTSHASVNVMLALEDEFDIEFPERLLRRSTFESIANLRGALETVLGVES